MEPRLLIALSVRHWQRLYAHVEQYNLKASAATMERSEQEYQGIFGWKRLRLLTRRLKRPTRAFDANLRVSSSSLFMLHIVWSIVVGFVVGLIASAIMHTHLGFVGTTLLGIVGSVVGGLIARLFSRPPEGSKFHPAGFLMSIIGAIVLVFLAKLIS
jgi:uncharacterized membrane protein YeaQ/YmgE (transglycosylase-associated protein family)